MNSMTIRDAASAAHRPLRRRRTRRNLARALALAAALACAGAAGAGAQERSPLDSISRLPGAAVERDTMPLLAPARLAALAPAARRAWAEYVARSRRLEAADRAFMAEELKRVGRARMTQAPYTHYFTLEPYMTPAWFRTDSARALALRLLTWQTPAGGWSKHVAMATRARAPGESFYGESDEWHYIATFDNDATTPQLRIIGGVVKALSGPGPKNPAGVRPASAAPGAEVVRKPESESEPEPKAAASPPEVTGADRRSAKVGSEPVLSVAFEPGHARQQPDPDSGSGSDSSDVARLRAAFLHGFDYIVAAQYPNGCFPQVYPLQGGYHDAVTFNDNVTVNVLRLLRDVAGGMYGFVPASVRARARADFGRGLDCVLRSQVVVRGVKTVWGQQQDPLTLRPAPARSYELAGLAGRESAWILDFLMELPAPSPRVVAAVHAGAAWFQAHAIRDSSYAADQVLRVAPGAGPIWARNTEVPSMRPIFANRDGIKLYDWNRLTDRRSGYGWFGTEPAATLDTFRRWALRHPRSPSRTREVAP